LGVGELRTSDLDYTLPSDRIAVTPADPRDAARLLVARRGPKFDVAAAAHRIVRDLPALLIPGDVLVFNTTRVVNARLEGARADTGGHVEGLYLRPGSSPSTWIVMLRGKRMKPGAIVALNATCDATRPEGSPIEHQGVSLRLLHTIDAEPGAWEVQVEEGASPLASAGLDVLSRVGHVPLPPYILKARRDRHVEVDESSDRERYQTVFAHADTASTNDASIAAPTAGLHFTPTLLDALAARGIERVDVTLEVGPGTFKPVETETVQQHPMHSERCWMTTGAIEHIQRARREGRRIVAVGTTSCRTLEAYALACVRGPAPASLETNILIAPGHAWRWVDALLTNFHLPRSTLMALVGALLDPDGGVARLVALYEDAIRREYRFYSYGDAMLILPDALNRR